MKKTLTKKKVQKKEVKKVVKKAQYEYFVSFIDNNNKFGSMIVDMNFLINSNTAVKNFNMDMNRALNGNFRCIVNFIFLRRKYINVEVKNEN